MQLRSKPASRREGRLMGMVALFGLAVSIASLPLASGDDDDDDDDLDLEPLSSVEVPRPDNLGDYVKSEAAALVLGKALFWDQQVGSDGVTACASCHFHAGADNRVTNTIAPGANGVFDAFALGGTVSPSDFPILTDDIAGSQGVVSTIFDGISPGSAVDDGTPTPSPIFGDLRQVTGRNSPTVINAVFHDRNFWDGRAMNHFNGVDPGGDESDATILAVSGGDVVEEVIELEDSSLGSQAVGPPNSDVEMAWAGRTFPDIGKKMLLLTPLGDQEIAVDDSVLGAFRDGSGSGLSVSYAELIMDAFEDRFWDSDAIVDRTGAVIGSGTPSGLDEFSLMEFNFSFFWGLSIQIYEATLVSDDTLFDRVARGEASFTARERRGFELFDDDAECSRCHREPETTNASSQNGGNGRAFVNIGVRPTSEDPGIEDGEFKSSTLRNTELNGPYFHNGGQATLRQVIEFYDRGGDFPNDDLDPLGLSESDKVALVDFLLTLTDERVRINAAPFDHPSLVLPNGEDLPAVGASGGDPIEPFLGLSPFTLDTGGGTSGGGDDDGDGGDDDGDDDDGGDDGDDDGGDDDDSPAGLTVTLLNGSSLSASSGGSLDLLLESFFNAGSRYVLVGTPMRSIGNTDLLMKKAMSKPHVLAVGFLDVSGLANESIEFGPGALTGLEHVTVELVVAVLDSNGQPLEISEGVEITIVD